MSDFDLDRYFAQREGAIFGPSDEGSVYSPRTPKQEELHRARLERRAQVLEALNSKTQTLPDWEHSLARGGFLDSDNAATLTGSMVTGTGKAVEAGAQALRQANPYELSPEIIALEQQRRDGIPLTPEQQALLDQAWEPQRSGPANAPAQWGEGPGGIPAQTLEGPQDRRRGEITVQQAAERARVMRELFQNPLADQFEKSGQAIREQGQEILDHRRPEFRREQEASMPDGDLFDPNSWTLGEDPTLSGFLANVIGVTGELVPIIAAGRIGGMPSAAVVGGLQAGGGQAEEVENHLRSLGESELREGFGLYAHLRDEGATHDEALDRTITEARKAAFNTGAVIGAVGGAATDALTRPVRDAVTQGITRNTVKAALLSAGEETVQEVGETVASRHAVNQATQGSLDLTEGTFGDAVLGAAAGGTVGAPAGFATGLNQAREQAQERINESDSPKLTRNQQAYAKAVESGDVSEIRNPAERVRALVERASNETLSPQEREEAAAAARKERDALRDAEQQIVRTQDEAWLARAEATLEKLQGEREATTDATARKELDADIKVIEASIQEARDLTDENSEISQDLARIQQRLQQANDHLAHLEQQQRNVEAEEREVQVVTGQAEASTPEEVESAVQNVITRAMMNESSLTPDQAQQIAGNAALSLTDSQRSFLQRFSEARQARHALNSAGDTHRDVMQGSPDGQYQGIQQYQQRFTEALQAGREANARQELRDIEAFAQQHRQKLEVAQQAWQRFRQDNQRSQWVYDKQNRAWTEHTGEPLSAQQLRANGGFEVGPRSNALINEWIPAEVEALESTVAEFKSALAVRREAAQTEVSSSEPAPGLLQQSNNESVQVPANETISPIEAVTNQPSAPSAPAETQPSTVPTESAQTTHEPVGDAAPQSEAVSEDSQATESETETQTDGSVPKQGSQEVLSERAAKETPTPTLTVLANAVKRVGLMGTNAAFQQANLIQEYLSQKFGTVRPLAGRSDFLAWLDGNLDRAESFLKEPLTDKQRETLAAFIARAQEWNPLIEANLPSPESRKRDYWYVDLPRFLFREDGTWDDNVYTAISHAVFGWIADNGVRQEPNSDAMVNAILGREGSHPVTAKERALLMDKGVQRQVLFSRLGKQITDALGLSAGRDVPQDIMPKLQSQMGAHAAALMVNEGLAEWTTVSGRELKAAVQEGTSVRMDEEGSLTFLRMVPQSQRNGAIQHQINDIVTASRGSQSILNKLFGSEAGVRFPELAPVKFAQNAAKRQRHGLPSMLKRILNKENQRPHRLRDDMLKAVEWLSEGGNDTFLEAVVGITQEGSRYVHSSNALGIEGRNDGHRRSIDRFREFVEILRARSEGGELPAFFFDRRAWVMHRVGLHSNGFNPQQDKFHRHLMSMEGWETEVPVNPTTEAEQAIQDQFMLAVADGLGVKTDKQLNVDSLLEMVMRRLEDPVIVKGAKALQRVINGEVPEVGDKEAVVAAVQEGGQNTHSLDALMNLAHYLNAQDMNQPTFTVSMAREVDGVTNGPALAQVLLGSAESPEMLAEWAKKAGFMPVGEEATHYTAWRSRKGSRDMYETTADDMRSTVLELREQASGNTESLRVFNALAYFTGSLEGKAGRNMVKTPLTALMFGSSVTKAVDSMATEFMQGIYNRLEEIANIEDTATRETVSREFARRVESLTGQRVNIQDARQSLNWTLSAQEERAVRKHFNDTLGKGVKASLEYRYKEFLDRRSLYNQAANTGFKLFQATYEHRRNQLIEELMDRHDRGEEGGMPYSRTKDGKRIPLQDLTENQEIELLNELSHMVPMVNTPFSKASRERENGIYLGNREATVGDKPAYAGEVSFKGVASATSNRKVKSIKTRSPEMRDSEPGVRALIFMIHSTDSAISAFAYEKLAALNIHDAHGLGLSQVTEGARNLNQNTFNLLAGFSPGEELTNSLNRTVAGFLQYVQENPENAEALKPAYRRLASEVDAFMARGDIAIMQDSPGVDAIGRLLNQMASEARKADEIKLDFLENTAVVDQYANEGGSYEVTDADRSRVRKIRETLAQRYRINQEMLKELAKLNAPRQFRKETTEPVSPTATARTAFGDLGTPKVAPELYLDQVLRQNPNVTARDLLRVIQDQLPEDTWSSGFQKRLIAALVKTLPATTRIQYVTRETAPLQDVDGKIMTNARGWSTLRPDGNTVYLKSPDFVTSGLTTELVLHELVHAALMHVVHGKPTQAARALVKDLESLRQEAKSFMKGSPLESRFAEAVKNVDELLAWGLTNKEFQDNVLRRVENPEASNRSRNRLITGMQKFIRAIHRALFGTDMAKPGDNANGLARLIENGAGLLAEAAAHQQEQGSSTTRAYQDPDPMQFTTQEVFEALRDSRRPLDGRTERLLSGVLDSIVDSLHGPFGAYKARAMELAATTAEDSFLRAVVENKAPFVSQVHNQGFDLNNQQAFVLEQVEATLKETLGSHHAARRQLSQLHRQVAAKVTARDLYAGDWNTATQQQQTRAEAQRAFLFETAGNERYTDTLARFAAMALVYPPLQAQLGQSYDAALPAMGSLTLGERIARIFKQLLDALSNRMARTRYGQPADDKLAALVHTLVDAEVKHRARLQRGESITQKLEAVGKDTLHRGVERIGSIAESAWVRNNGSDTVRFLGALTATVAGDRVGQFVDGLQKVRNKGFKERQGLVMSMINEMRGDRDETQVFFELQRMATRYQQQQIQVADQTSKGIVGAFREAGKHFTERRKEALTRIGVRAGLADLVDTYSMAELESLVSDTSALDAAIAQREQPFAKRTPENSAYLTEAKELAWYMATGEVVSEHQQFNTYAIAHRAGTQESGTVDPKKAERIAQDLDILVSLYALRYSDKADRAVLSDLMREEAARNDGGNGVEYVLKITKHLQQEALERNFNNNRMMMHKGYAKEILNPHIEPVAVSPEEGKQLELEGWEFVEVLPQDRTPGMSQEPKHLYVMRDRGLRRYVTGLLSPTSLQAKGTQMHSGHSTATGMPLMQNRAKTQQVLAARQAVHRKATRNGWTYDPSKNRKVRQAPIFNELGEVTGYRYMMTAKHRDDILQRNNRVDDVLGAMAASVIDKETSVIQNKQGLEALYADYKSHYLKNPDDYLMVGPHSPDPEMREHWRLLSPETQREVVRQWGKEEMWVRKELADLVLGYRKMSIAEAFERDPEVRTHMQRFFVATMEAAFGKKVGKRLRQVEDVWQETARLIKDTVVIKNIVTLMGNEISNISQLWLSGVPIRDIVNHKITATKASLDYQRDSDELSQLVQQQEAGLGNAATVQRIRQLEDALQNNPVHEMVEAGLMPTIIEDVDNLDDPFSYKSRMTQWLDDRSARLPKTVNVVARNVLMTHDTRAYRFLHKATQLSDFTARYALAQHYMNRSRDPLSKRDAFNKVSRAFVNYDVPTHRKLQYLNDMFFLPFTKYYLRIQRTILELYRDNPARVASMLLMKDYLDGAQVLLESELHHKLDSNPFNKGALELPGALGELPAIKMMGGWVQ